jgi:hypothetical protein
MLPDIAYGNNGLMIAILIGLSLYLLKLNPVHSGIVVGIVVYKPHMALLLPVFFLAQRQNKVFRLLLLLLH